MPETHSGYSSYSPISTLERQYASPVGQRLFVFVQGNPACCVDGGVEAVLKMGSPKAAKTKSVTDDYSSSSNGFPPVETENAQEDPFGFLSSGTPASQSTSSSKRGFGNKFMSSIKKTTKTIERGMHSMAIKADKGRNPDWYVVGLYDASNTLICMTDSIHANEDGLAFVIPLVIPPTLENQNYKIKLWIRSGATLLSQTKAAKNYLVGSVSINTSQLRSVLEASGTHAITSLHLESSICYSGELQVCVATDLKFPVLCGRGWSLTDPDVSGYTKNSLHHLPLDQSYGYFSSSGDSSWLIATERCTESTIVLPIATALSALVKDASQISLNHASSASEKLLANRHDSLEGNNAFVNVSIGHLVIDPMQFQQEAASAASISMSWQRPDCIFEVELLPPGTKLPVHTSSSVPFMETCVIPFYAKICALNDPNILAAVIQKLRASPNPPPFLLGSLRLQVKMQKAGRDAIDGHISEGGEFWQAIVPLEAYININATEPMSIPLHHSVTNAPMGTLMVRLEVGTGTQQPQALPTVSSQGGLVSLVGLDTLLEDSGTAPVLDYDIVPSPAAPPPSPDPAKALRKQQLQTMGNFVTHAYLDQHVSNVRSADNAAFQDRYTRYGQALSKGTQDGEDVPSFQDKTPKPFRPSSSRNEEVLAGIGFNVHIQSLSLVVLDSQPGAAPDVSKGALFHNITCGAPADHARGFGNALGNPSSSSSSSTSTSTATTIVGTISGGLRRLETKRVELAKALVDAQTKLISAVGRYLSSEQGRTHHISARHTEIATLRWTVFETTQSLHSITWTCAVRRASVFSQALGIAVSSFLTSISDSAKLRGGWADLWVRRGYLVTYEGLLSAAGKELGMIEDASVGIAMLRMVHIVLVSANDNSTPASVTRIPVPRSPYLRFVQLTYSGQGPYTQYRLEIGVDPLYYAQRVPEPLKNGAAVQLYPVLYQVGVDIRQWGAHTGMNVRNNLTGGDNDEMEPVGGGLIEDEEDDVGVPDNDVLVALNYEACRKMNAYAHMISPVSNNEGTAQDVHPLMKTLHAQVMSSAGKMVHGIVDEAATVAQKLGGGGVVFCKSGKDRTAMQVTYKQSQFVNRFLGQPDQSGVFENATLMRVYGTRLPICEKNVGQAKFAFNSLQVKFMPDMLKPPPNTLAGFLKGGRVFSREGAIES